MSDNGHPLRDGLSSQAMEPQASPPTASIPDALTDRVAQAVHNAVYGTNLDPFEHPEAWDFSVSVAKSAMDSGPVALLNALKLARNRLHRVGLDLPHGSLIQIECFEWAEEATATINKVTGQ